MFSLFLCAYLLSRYLLCEVSVKVFGSLFNWVVCFLIIEFSEFFVHFE